MRSTCEKHHVETTESHPCSACLCEKVLEVKESTPVAKPAKKTKKAKPNA